LAVTRTCAGYALDNNIAARMNANRVFHETIARAAGKQHLHEISEHHAARVAATRTPASGAVFVRGKEYAAGSVYCK